MVYDFLTGECVAFHHERCGREDVGHRRMRRYRVVGANGKLIPFVAWCNSTSGEVHYYEVRRVGNQVVFLMDNRNTPRQVHSERPALLVVVELKNGKRVDVDGESTWPDWEYSMTPDEIAAIPELVVPVETVS